MPTATLKQARQTVKNLIAAGGSLTTGSQVLSSAQDPGSTPDQEMILCLNTGFGGTPTAGLAITVYFVQALDTTGTVYEDGDGTSTTPPIPVWTFSTQATNALKQVSPPVRIPATPYKIIVKNGSGQTMSTGWTLDGFPVDQQAAW